MRAILIFTGLILISRRIDITLISPIGGLTRVTF